MKSNLKNFYPNSNVDIITTKVTKANINDLIIKKSNNKKIDFFSLDIDSNDYWILNTMDLSNISVICCEYNHWLGKEKKLTIPYDENFKFIDNGIWGASLKALDNLLKNKGFSLIAVESSGTNAFFVNHEFRDKFDVLSVSECFKSVGRFYSEDKKKEIFKNIKNQFKLLKQV